MTAGEKSGRSPLLDCIRAVAVLGVLVYHVGTRFPMSELDPVALFLRLNGLFGVDIFFPLSGFLITSFLLRQSGDAYVKVFFLRRFFRIVPIYVVAVTIFLVIALMTGHEREILHRIWINYTFLTGWFIFLDGVDTVPYTITWSLSVEEFAYICFGLFAWVSRKMFPIFIVIVAILPIFLRAELFAAQVQGLYFYPLARVDSIALGGVTAFLIHRRAPVILILLGILICTQMLRGYDQFISAVLFNTTFSLFVCIVISVIHKYFLMKSNLLIRAAASIGFYSYFMYLFHFFFIAAVLYPPPLFSDIRIQFWFVCIVSFALTYAAAVISMRAFEGPIMRYGRRLEGSARMSAERFTPTTRS